MSDEQKQVKGMWRSLDEYADTPAFRAWVESEFPAMAAELDRAGGGFSRRRLLTYMGASLGLAGLGTMSGCRRQQKNILPYQVKPPEIVPGKALYYATTVTLAGQPIGVLAETHEGRPTKLEGNPKHPASRGSLPSWAQASILDLYDPDRSRVNLHDGKPVRWKDDVVPMLDELGRRYREKKGQGLAILMERYASPAVDHVLEHLVQGMPDAVICEFEPSDGVVANANLNASRVDLSRAKVILALDADFLNTEEQGTRHQRAFAAGRSMESPDDAMNRLYVVEPHLTVTGLAADHRLRLKASLMTAYVSRLARAVAERIDENILLHKNPLEKQLDSIDAAWIDAVADDLVAHRHEAAVIASKRQPRELRIAVDQLNRALKGTLNDRSRHPWMEMTQAQAEIPCLDQRVHIAELASRMEAGDVETLLILGGNPAYDAPADLGMGSLIEKVNESIHLSHDANETSAAVSWHIPAAHALESWGNGWDGEVLSSQQPMIDPLYGGKTPTEILARVGGYGNYDPYQIARDSFRRITGDVNFEQRWRKHLHEGFTKLKALRPADSQPWENLETTDNETRIRWVSAEDPLSAEGIEIVFGIDASVYDGRFANNGWLQECPDPVTKLTWDNAAICSPNTAKKLDARTGDHVTITVGDARVTLPVLIMPGSADDSILLPLGYGRRAGGHLAQQAGFDVYPLRTSTRMGFTVADSVKRSEGTTALATTQDHWSIDLHEIVDDVLEERAIVREADLETWREDPEFAQHMGMHLPHHDNISQAPEMTGEHQWAMVIDLTKCIGCNACAVACQAENNIPVVGKDEVMMGREMNWMRVDRYFRGDDPSGDVGVTTQPMLCQHCENAPCEPVCPVNATVHDHDGLNVMVYNRCIGTRYCSNNCPYKVRRFNFYEYNSGVLGESDAPFDGENSPNPTEGLSLPVVAHPPIEELAKMQKNPDVTVRMRGVMEKCTFCVQRIQRAKIDMKVQAGQQKADLVPDDMLQTSCQQACPSQAIVFGNQSDPDSAVAKAQKNSRNYEVLEHLNVRPRTTYLARVRNLNPAMPRPAWLNVEIPHHGHGNGKGKHGSPDKEHPDTPEHAAGEVHG